MKLMENGEGKSPASAAAVEADAGELGRSRVVCLGSCRKLIRKIIFVLCTLATAWMAIELLYSYARPDKMTIARFSPSPYEPAGRRIRAGIVADNDVGGSQHFTFKYWDDQVVDPIFQQNMAFHQRAFWKFSYKSWTAWSYWNPGVQRIHNKTFSMPAWLAIGMAATYPAAITIFRGFRYLHRLRRGLCIKCGYNLTGAPEPRCPECGTAI